MQSLGLVAAGISLAVVTFASQPGAEGLDLSELNSAEEANEARAAKTLVAFMSLETMFPDHEVRLLASAAGKGQLDEVDRLVAEGVDVNATGTQNATPLFWSMRSLSGFTKLLELGADPNVIFLDGGSVMHWAARADNAEYLEAALRHEGNPNLVGGAFKRTPLFEAIGSEARSIELLLDAGADINARSENGDTTVMVAAGRGRFDTVYLLLTHGASYSATNYSGVGLTDRIADKNGAMDPDHGLSRWLDRVIKWLHERGVEIAG